MQVEPHYEIRRIVTDFERSGARVTLNLGIRYKDDSGEQVGPPSRLDVELTGPQFTRANPAARLTVREDAVLAAAKAELGSSNVEFAVSPEDDE